MKPQRQLTRAERRRQATDARTASNLRSIAIAKAVLRSQSEAHRVQVRAHMAELSARLDRGLTDEERQRAREILAEAPYTRQRHLFQGNA